MGANILNNSWGGGFYSADLHEAFVYAYSKKVFVEVDEAGRNWLAEYGYDKIMGARPMERLIREKIKKPLAEELLFGKLEHGGHVIVTEENNDIKLEILEEETAEKIP